MAIVTMMRINGDPEQLLEQKQEVVDPIIREVAAANGGLEHITVKTDEGLMVINVWEHAEGMEAVSEAVGPKAQEAGLPAPEGWQQFEIAQRVVF